MPAKSMTAMTLAAAEALGARNVANAKDCSEFARRIGEERLSQMRRSLRLHESARA